MVAYDQTRNPVYLTPILSTYTQLWRQMSDGTGVTLQGWVLIFTSRWGPTVMAENVSPPSPSLPAIFPRHLVTLSAAQGGGGKHRVACFMLLLQMGKLRHSMAMANVVNSSSGAAATLKTSPCLRCAAARPGMEGGMFYYPAGCHPA